MNQFGLIVEFEVPENRLDEFHRLLAVNAQASVQKESGCHVFDVLHEDSAPTKVVLYEIYESKDAFAEHVAAEHTKTFLAAAKEIGAKQTIRRLTRVLAPVK